MAFESDIDYLEILSGGPTLTTSKLLYQLTGVKVKQTYYSINHFLILERSSSVFNLQAELNATIRLGDDSSAFVLFCLIFVVRHLL